MVLFNYSTKELTAKVVYYGPGLCGKTTNLQWIHEKLPIKNKGKMLSLATETDRTLFFDFLPIEIGTIRGMKTRIQLYTVPGQVFYNATRRMVLKGADAVVFVCDSQEAMLDANLESFENMRQNLEANEIDPDEIPIVLQYNKRDLPNALPIEILNERMNPHSYPFREAIAVTGSGVEDTLKAVTKLVFKSLSAKYGESAPPPSAPGAGRAPAPPRTTPPPPPPGFSAGGSENVLEGLASAPQSPAPSSSLPPVVVEDEVYEKTPATAFGQPLPPPTAVATHDPQGTLVSSRNEAEELRRRIANPGIPQNEVEMDLEEIDEVTDSRLMAPSPHSPPISPGTAPRSPSPLRSAASGAVAPGTAPRVDSARLAGNSSAPPTEVEVPIDVEVAPGTTRVRLNLRLVLNFKRR
jgi:signal recognition particle receptor subunit beta